MKKYNIKKITYLDDERVELAADARRRA